MSAETADATALRFNAAAFVGAFATRFGATLAVLVIVLLAFRGARIADFGAKLAKFRVESRATAHEAGSHPAEVGAVNAKPRAFFHAAEALVAAVLAFLRATDAGFNTGLMFLMCHWIFLSGLLVWLFAKGDAQTIRRSQVE